MATAEQIKALIRSHAVDDEQRFYTLALQIAAHEAQQGHGALALEIRDIVDRAKVERRNNPAAPLPAELEALIETDLPGVPAAALVVPHSIAFGLDRVLREYRQREKLRRHSLDFRRKLLLVGPPGCGKTLTARVIAHELRLSLYTVQVDRLITRYMGETSSRLRLIFDSVRERAGVYFFDEFDSIGGGRERENDVGEMRRVLTSLLQFIEKDESNSLIIAATNSPELLDRALFRRFDDVLVYDLPGPEERRRLVANSLGTFAGKGFGWKGAIGSSAGLSAADIVSACRSALKDAVLADESTVTAKHLAIFFEERQRVHRR